MVFEDLVWCVGASNSVVVELAIANDSVACFRVEIVISKIAIGDKNIEIENVENLNHIDREIVDKDTLKITISINRLSLQI